MTPRQRELARHALGLPNDRRKSYRNRFVAGELHRDYSEWQAMVERGDAERHDGKLLSFGGSHLFCLTEQGARAALEPGEHLDREDFPNG